MSKSTNLKVKLSLWGAMMMLLSITSFAQISWNFIPGNQTLIINGNGAMPDYTTPPWNYYLNDPNWGINSIEIYSGITRIGNNAFNITSYQNEYKLTSVYIDGNNLTSIGQYAFQNCKGLTYSFIPSSVTSIENSAFKNCFGLPSVTIHEGVTSIGNSAFAGCIGLHTVNFNAINCTTMGSSANPVFGGCAAFATLNIGNMVTNIPSYAFKGCSGLTSVTIHEGIASIGNNAFANCTSLHTVNFNAVNCTTMGGTLLYPVFDGCTASATLNIGNMVTQIPSYAFRGFSGLTSVTIGNSVTSIGESAFRDCTSLTSSVTIPNNVTSIGNYAFMGCSSLNAATIGTGVTSIGGGAFQNCTSLQTLNFNAINCAPMFMNTFSGITSATLNIGNMVTQIPDNAFSGFSGLTSVTIGNSVTSIGDDAFYYCSGLTSVTIPDNVTSIGNNAFGNCTGLTSVTIGESVTSIENYAFTGCSNLASITIHATTPPDLGFFIFFNVPSTIPVNIPCGTYNAYNNSPWNLYFNNFVESCVNVTNIANVPTTTLAGVPLTLTGTVQPPNASFQTIIWSIEDAGTTGATISSGNVLNTTAGGTAIIKATIENGLGSGQPYTQNCTITVTKNTQTPPAAPTLASKTPTSITLNTISGCEYRRDNGAWQTSTTFSGLTPNTTYSFYARYAETPTHYPSDPSPAANFTTDKATLTGTVTITGNAVFGATLTANTSGLSSNPQSPLGTLSYQWKRNGTNIGSNSSTYTLVQADIGSTITVTVTAANCTGSVTSNPTATVQKATQTAPAAPTLASKTATSIILNTISGCEYRRDNGAWQTSTTFSGLTPNTSYSFYARKAETATHQPSPASSAANFTTDIIPVTEIVNVPTATIMNVPLTLTGTVIPSDATFQTIEWSLLYPGTTNATVTGGKLYTSAPGTAVVLATIKDGKAIGTDYTQECSIEVTATFVPVTDITGVPTVATASVPLTLTATVIPTDASNQTIIWSVKTAGTTNATITGNIFTATAAGTAVITATIKDGKAVGEDFKKDFTIEVGSVGIAETEHGIDVQVYPNPTNGVLEIESGKLRVKNVGIFDIMGKLLRTYELRLTTNIIDISGLSTGVYFLKIEIEAGIVVKKIVKE